MSYITANDYNEITGDNAQNATDARIKRSSRLLDTRIGNHKRESEFKLDLEKLPIYQKEAVKEWTAWMVFALQKNKDSIEVNESVKLGRFSVTARQGKSDIIPDSLIYADSVLKSSGIVKTGVKYTNSPTTGVVINV